MNKEEEHNDCVHLSYMHPGYCHEGIKHLPSGYSAHQPTHVTKIQTNLRRELVTDTSGSPTDTRSKASTYGTPASSSTYGTGDNTYGTGGAPVPLSTNETMPPSTNETAGGAASRPPSTNATGAVPVSSSSNATGGGTPAPPSTNGTNVTAQVIYTSIFTHTHTKL